MKWILIVLSVFAFIIVCNLVSGLIIWALWNFLVPSLFHGPAITYWQGLAISITLSIIGGVFSKSST